MFKKIIISVLNAMELSVNRRILVECHGILDKEEIYNIRKRMSELSSK